jgi:hypothetical protein
LVYQPRLGNLEKKGLSLAQSSPLFGTGWQLIIRTEFGQNASHLSAASRNHLLSEISTTSSKSTDFQIYLSNSVSRATHIVFKIVSANATSVN